MRCLSWDSTHYSNYTRGVSHTLCIVFRENKPWSLKWKQLLYFYADWRFIIYNSFHLTLLKVTLSGKHKRQGNTKKKLLAWKVVSKTWVQNIFWLHVLHYFQDSAPWQWTYKSMLMYLYSTNYNQWPLLSHTFSITYADIIFFSIFAIGGYKEKGGV